MKRNSIKNISVILFFMTTLIVSVYAQKSVKSGEVKDSKVFLDETGKEYYRHVGFFPEEELVKLLQMKGIKMN